MPNQMGRRSPGRHFFPDAAPAGRSFEGRTAFLTCLCEKWLLTPISKAVSEMLHARNACTSELKSAPFFLISIRDCRSTVESEPAAHGTHTLLQECTLQIGHMLHRAAQCCTEQSKRVTGENVQKTLARSRSQGGISFKSCNTENKDKESYYTVHGTARHGRQRGEFRECRQRQICADCSQL